jgi:hypothetical protein
MAKPQKSKEAELELIELTPDAWERFEGFVKTKVRTAPIKKATSRPAPATRKASKSK